jgi:hypothetical protein
MKIALFCLAFMIGTVHAAEIKILDIPSIGFANLYNRFRIDREANRAWVETEVEKLFDSDWGPARQTINTYPQGLEFDSTRNMITFTHEGQQFECAEIVQTGRIFRRGRITHKDCDFKAKAVMVNREKRYQVYLVTK